MKVLIVYDSVYGNTEQIARAIAGAFGPGDDVAVGRHGEIKPEQVRGIELLIVGAPTQGARPTQAMLAFLNQVTEDVIKGINFASFDTRLSTKWVGIFGYAAGKIAKSLESKGGNLVVNPEGFFVKGTKGPLKDGELERAAGWAKGLIAAKK